MGAYRRDLLVEKGYRLDAGNFKALAATNVLTGHEVVTADHIRASFGELGAITFVSAPRQLALLGANNPAKIVFGSLMAMRAVQCCFAGLLSFVEEVAFVHHVLLLPLTSGAIPPMSIRT